MTGLKMLTRIILSVFMLFFTQQVVAGGASVAVIYFPRSQFSQFAREIARNREHLEGEQGVIEVLTYRIRTHIGNDWPSTYALAAVSFPTKDKALKWLSKDPTVQSRERWSNGQYVGIIVVETTLSRFMPLSTGHKAHLFGIASVADRDEFSKKFEVPFRKTYIENGGQPTAAVTNATGWLRFEGMQWPPDDNALIFIGPMPNMESVDAMFEEENLPLSVQVPEVNMYAVESFFNSAVVHTRPLFVILLTVLAQTVLP